jgi:hypothetical protein
MFPIIFSLTHQTAARFTPPSPPLNSPFPHSPANPLTNQYSRAILSRVCQSTMLLLGPRAALVNPACLLSASTLLSASATDWSPRPRFRISTRHPRFKPFISKSLRTLFSNGAPSSLFFSIVSALFSC